MPRWTWLVLLVLCLPVAAPARADRDIVYAARYYAPPGSHRTSHFHLYRINPDGTGKMQLTSGIADDQYPKWSPDGTRIAFTRLCQNGQTRLCLIHASGGSVQTLLPPGRADAAEEYGYRWSPNSRTLAVLHRVYDKTGISSVALIAMPARKIVQRLVGASGFQWSPDGRRAYVDTEAGDTLLDWKSGQETAVKDRVETPVWLDNQRLLGLASDPKTERYFLRLVGRDGRETRHLPLRFPAAYAGTGTEDDPALSLGSLTGIPFLVYGVNEHNSTVGVEWAFFRLSLAANTMRYLTDGQFLAWSPDGLQFCTAPGRDTTPYEKRRFPFAVRKGASVEEHTEDKYRIVWSAPLYVRAAAGGPMRALTPRLSWVTAADWRRTTKAALQRNR